ncbi:unnamed protein product [Camellia sinensis]
MNGGERRAAIGDIGGERRAAIVVASDDRYLRQWRRAAIEASIRSN